MYLFSKNRTLFFKFKRLISLKRKKIHIIKISNNNYIHYKHINHNYLNSNENEYIFILIPKYKKFLNNDRDKINIMLLKNNEILFHKKFIHYKDVQAYWKLDFHKKIKDLKVLSILDPFSHSIFNYEFQNIPLNINYWKNQISYEKPDLILVESVWNSVCSGLNLSYPNNLQLFRNIINYCKSINIKIIFWNKEDSINFDKFIWLAKIFPIICTTDLNCVSKYKKISRHSNVFVLPFGITPKLHNTFLKNNVVIQDILFAGRWYYGKEFGDRIKDMHILFSDFNFLKQKKIVIFDRNYNKLQNKKSFPNQFLPFLKESVDYNTICILYRHFKILYNVNSVQNSPTMFSRRVLESIACKTFVLSAYSLALKNLNLKSIFFSKNNSQTKKFTNFILKNYNDLLKIIHLDFINIYRNHTMTNRLENIFQKINFTFQSEAKKCFVLVQENFNFNSPQNYKNLFFIQLHTSDDFKIEYKDQNYFIIHYNSIDELLSKSIFNDAFIFMMNTNLQYNHFYISNYLLHYKYLTSKINFENTIISKSLNEKDSNNYDNNYVNGTISFHFNPIIFKYCLNKINNVKIYKIDCYDYQIISSSEQLSSSE